MKFLTAIVTVSLVIMITASAGYYFYNSSVNNSSYPSYHVDMHLNTTIPVPYYPIYVNSNLTGNGTYQQLLTFSDPSHYGINANGSNLAFYDGSNNTHLYAWIQSINSTSMQVWVKNYYGNSVINLEVMPEFENLLSANGYLGKWGTQTDNGKKVFNFYTTFYNGFNTSLFDIGTSGNAGYKNTTSGLLLWDYENVDSISGAYILSKIDFSGNFSLIQGINLQGTNDIQDARARIYLVTSFSGIDSSSSTPVSDATSGDYGFYGTGKYERTFNNSNLFNFTPSQYTDIQYYYGSNFRIQDFGYNGTISNPITNAPVGGTWYIEDQASSDGGQENEYTNVTVQFSAIGTALENGMPTFTIGNGTNLGNTYTQNINIAYNHQNITIPSGNWYNVSLKAYSNYSYSFYYNDFPMYFNYSGLINNTFYTGFLDRNVTISLNFIGDYYTGKTSMIILEGKQ